MGLIIADENRFNSDQENTDVWTKIHDTLDCIAERQENTDKQMAKTEQMLVGSARRHAEIDEQIAESSRQMVETDKKISRLGDQYGGLHNKFGSFTEDLAKPSIERILEEEFKADYSGDNDMWHLKEVGPLQVDA